MRTCNGKVRYRDHEKAINALQCLHRNSERQKLPHRAYACAKCKGYHLSSKPNSTDRIVEKLAMEGVEQ